MRRLEAVQNIAIRSIFRLPYDNPSEDGLRRANRISIHDRLLMLGHNYIEKCIVNSNPVITEMIDEYKRYSGSRILNNCTPLCSFDDLVWPPVRGQLTNWVKARSCLTTLMSSKVLYLLRNPSLSAYRKVDQLIVDQ